MILYGSVLTFDTSFLDDNLIKITAKCTLYTVIADGKQSSNVLRIRHQQQFPFIIGLPNYQLPLSFNLLRFMQLQTVNTFRNIQP